MSESLLTRWVQVTAEDIAALEKDNAALRARIAELEKASTLYMSQFGQALEAYKIPFTQTQRDADEALRAALNPDQSKNDRTNS